MALSLQITATFRGAFGAGIKKNIIIRAYNNAKFAKKILLYRHGKIYGQEQQYLFNVKILIIGLLKALPVLILYNNI